MAIICRTLIIVRYGSLTKSLLPLSISYIIQIKAVRHTKIAVLYFFTFFIIVEVRGAAPYYFAISAQTTRMHNVINKFAKLTPSSKQHKHTSCSYPDFYKKGYRFPIKHFFYFHDFVKFATKVRKKLKLGTTLLENKPVHSLARVCDPCRH